MHNAFIADKYPQIPPEGRFCLRCLKYTPPRLIGLPPGSTVGLKNNALHLHDNYLSDYEATIKKHAQEEWGDDYQMVVYTINTQADALVELVEVFKSEYTNTAFNAILEWSINGYQSSNRSTLSKITIFGFSQLIALHCDWQMVKYEYDNQVKAKDSY